MLGVHESIDDLIRPTILELQNIILRKNVTIEQMRGSLESLAQRAREFKDAVVKEFPGVQLSEEIAAVNVLLRYAINVAEELAKIESLTVKAAEEYLTEIRKRTEG